MEHLLSFQQVWVQNSMNSETTSLRILCVDQGKWSIMVHTLSGIYRGPCPPTPQLEPNIYHPLVKILSFKDFLRLFLFHSFSHSLCLQSHSAMHLISKPSNDNWFLGIGERQIAPPFSQKSQICFVCKSFTSTGFFFFFAVQHIVNGIRKKQHYLNSKQNESQRC